MTTTREFRRTVEGVMSGILRATEDLCDTNLDATTTDYQDLSGCSRTLSPGRYVVWGIFEPVATTSGADRIFVGRLLVGSTVAGGTAHLKAQAVLDRATISQMWTLDIDKETVIKLQAAHAGGTTGEFLVYATYTKLVTLRIG